MLQVQDKKHGRGAGEGGRLVLCIVVKRVVVACDVHKLLTPHFLGANNIVSVCSGA